MNLRRFLGRNHAQIPTMILLEWDRRMAEFEKTQLLSLRQGVALRAKTAPSLRGEISQIGELSNAGWVWDAENVSKVAYLWPSIRAYGVVIC